MTKELFYLLTEKLELNSVKKACFIVREFLRESQDINCAVSFEEYLEAIKIILAYSYQTSDEFTTVDLYYCPGNCVDNGKYGFCEGEFSRNDNSLKLCPYYIKEQEGI